MKNSLNRLLRKYYWMSVVAIAILGSWWLGLQAWDNLHTPRLVDRFWNPTLKMWEPVYSPESPEWLNVIMLMPTVLMLWWHSPVYFQIPYTLSLLYAMLLFWGYRPCIDIPSGRVADGK